MFPLQAAGSDRRGGGCRRGSTTKGRCSNSISIFLDCLGGGQLVHSRDRQDRGSPWYRGSIVRAFSPCLLGL